VRALSWMPCCRASFAAASQRGSGIGERCTCVLRHWSSSWRTCSTSGGNNGCFGRFHQPVLLAPVGQQADVTRITRAQSCRLAETSRTSRGGEYGWQSPTDSTANDEDNDVKISKSSAGSRSPSQSEVTVRTQSRRVSVCSGMNSSWALASRHSKRSTSRARMTMAAGPSVA
jgi:hypothetical protein